MFQVVKLGVFCAFFFFFFTIETTKDSGQYGKEWFFIFILPLLLLIEPSLTNLAPFWFHPDHCRCMCKRCCSHSDSAIMDERPESPEEESPCKQRHDNDSRPGSWMVSTPVIWLTNVQLGCYMLFSKLPGYRVILLGIVWLVNKWARLNFLLSLALLEFS